MNADQDKKAPMSKATGKLSAERRAPKIADDPVYGDIRAAICDAYIAAGKPKPKENWLYSRLIEAKEEIRDYESLLELQRSRTIKADKLWQEAHSKPLTLPDLGTLVEWLITRAEAAERQLSAQTEGVRALLTETQVQLSKPFGLRDWVGLRAAAERLRAVMEGKA